MPSTILIVDDDPLARTLIRDKLQSEGGYSTVEAADGEEALACVRACPPDLILLDILMPGLDGFATYERLRADPATRAIPVIFVTSSRDATVNHRVYALGPLACIPKPFRREGLLSIVQMGLAHRSQQSPTA